MYKLTVKGHFDAAHYIKDYVGGPCDRLHGHRWYVDVCIEGETLDKRNILVDFSNVKKVLKDLFTMTLDHYCLNDMLPETNNVTAEYLAKWIFEQVRARNSNHLVDVKSVTVWESPECGVTYEP